MNPAARFPGLGLSSTEVNSIDDYRRRKNTAVLTIMFTDIEGFTALTEEKGESYVHELHSEHDRILVETIEENNAGIVIKYIGDSIMAVFSEPTAAVEKSLMIQRKLKAFNEGHPELEDIKVRIGLHMGQTVVENKIQLDLFGRHVNKASRIESLADGGHVFISYTVFDSAKTWLIDAKDVDYKLHGSYLLKGIKKPEEIYEVYNSDFTRPLAPRKGTKHASLFPLAAFALGACLLLAASLVSGYAVLAANKAASAALPAAALSPPGSASRAPSDGPVAEDLSRSAGEEGAIPPANPEPAAVPSPSPAPAPEVYFIHFTPLEPVLDLREPLAVTTVDAESGLKRSVSAISAGKHLIHYAVAGGVRYYAEIDVKPGKNVFEPVFSRSELPYLQVNLVLGSRESDTKTATDERTYVLYAPDSLDKKEHTGVLSATVSALKATPERIDFTVEYTVHLDGAEIAREKISIGSPLNTETRTYVDLKKLYVDSSHYYGVKYSYINGILQFTLGSGFTGK